MGTHEPADQETQGLLDRFVENTLAGTHPLLREWTGDAMIRETLRSSIEPTLRSVEDMERAREFHDACPRPGADVADYRRRIADFGADERALLALNFKGGVDGPPFVKLAATTGSVATLDAVESLRQAARDAYTVFEPRWLHLRVDTHQPWSTNARQLGASVDQDLLAAPIADLQARPRPDRDGDVGLDVCTDTSFYERYRAAFDALHAASPFHRAEVGPQDREEFDAPIAEGLVFRAFVDGEWAGLIAAFRERRHGMRGFGALELLLFEPFRGRGLAAAMQRELIDRLDGSGGALYWGVIAPGNEGSLRTALRNGRTHVASYWFVPL